MAHRLYADFQPDSLTAIERADYEDDVVSFCDRELDLMGDIRGRQVFYAGGTSVLWIEGLSQRIGPEGTLVVLDSNRERIESARRLLPEAELSAPVRLDAGDVFEPPFDPGTFDLVYSAGLFHELDVSKLPAHMALEALVSLVKPGGRVAASDFVDSVAAAQLEDEALEAELAAHTSGARLYGIGPAARLIQLHKAYFSAIQWQLNLPFPIRYLQKLVLNEDDYVLRVRAGKLPLAVAGSLIDRRRRLLKRIRREGYTRPATLYITGVVRSSAPG